MAAASFDSVISLALAYDVMLGENIEPCETDVLNKTLSQLQLNGLAVSYAA